MARRAFLMGNAAYETDSGLTDLRCPVNDVDGLSEVLSDPTLGGFETVTTLRNFTSTEARRALVRFLREEPRDTVLFYYSGHGKLDASFSLHLCTSESEIELLEATALPIGFVQDLLAKCRADNCVMLLDCCYSGAAKGVRARGDIGDALRLAAEGSGTYLLTASDSIETAQEKEGDRYGVFTKHVIEGLRSGAADREGRGFVTMDDLYDYVLRAVRADSPQRPNRQVGGHGDIVIARSGRDSRRDRADAARRALYGHVAEGTLDAELAQAAVEAPRTPVVSQSPMVAAIEAAALRFLDRECTLGQFVSAFWTAKVSLLEVRSPEGTRPQAGGARDQPSDDRGTVTARPPPAVSFDQDKLARAELEALGFEFSDDSVSGEDVDDAALARLSELQSQLHPPIATIETRSSAITSLAPLQGMRLKSLAVEWADQVTSLEPLKDMPLTKLSIGGGITDLEPLRGMPLTSLSITGCKGIVDLEQLRGIPLTELSLYDCNGIASLTPLYGMPLTELRISDCDSIASITPLHGMTLKKLTISLSKTLITNLDPLRGMPLTNLFLHAKAGIDNLGPLQGMRLTELALGGSEATSLAPLQGMPLTKLWLMGAKGITSLAPLQGMPLSELTLFGAEGITSVEPPQGMPLTELDLSYARRITNLEPLRGMPLTKLDLSHAEQIGSLEPLCGMPPGELDLSFCGKVSSLDPLEGMPLSSLSLADCGGITTWSPCAGCR